MSSVLDTALNLRRVVDIEEPKKKKRGRKPKSDKVAKGNTSTEKKATRTRKKSSTATSGKKGKKKPETTIEKPQRELFSYEEKKAYCDAKYGEGNWSFMTREECMERFIEERGKKRMLEELKNGR